MKFEKLEYTLEFLLENIEENDKKFFAGLSRSLKLEVQLDSKFPQRSGPRIFMKDLPDQAESLCNDGRDFLDDIIKQSWNPSIFLTDILKSIPGFLVFFEIFKLFFYCFIERSSKTLIEGLLI